MIEIKKNAEPKSLLTYRQQPNATYADIPKMVKDDIIQSLMAEQGYLCAYCMRRIPQKKKNPGVSIEHWDSQSGNNTAMGLNYQNMLAVCSGNRGCGDKKNLTCDARRGNAPLTVNPLKPETLRNIAYKESGVIYSTDEVVNHDINQRLNLNCESILLPDCRKNALQALQEKVMADNPGKTASKDYFRKLLHKLSQANTEKQQYVGILIYWLEAKAK